MLHNRVTIVHELLFLGDTKYVAVTYRLFKMSATREKTAKQVTYKGHVKGNEKEIPFDHQNIFKVCMIIWTMPCENVSSGIC